VPQNAFHALLGAAVARRAWPGRVPWVLGFVLGSMAPDVDVLPLAIIRAAGAWAPSLHRTASHSLSLIAGFFAVAGLARLRWREAAAFTGAFALGMLCHVLLDLVLWFSGVDLLWPLGVGGGRREVNLWAWLELPPVAGNPDLIGNELAALDAAAFGLYLQYLTRLAKGSGRSGWLLALSAAAAAVCWALFPVYVITGVFWSAWRHSFWVYAPTILLFFPIALISTIAFRRPLAGQGS